MPSGEQILYEDSLFPRVYAYHPASDRKVVLAGRVGCVDASTDRFVLLPEEGSSPLPCRLVTLRGQDARQDALPALPVPGPSAETIIWFGPTPDTLLALHHGNHYGAPTAYYTLSIGEQQWRKESIPSDLAGKEYRRYSRYIHLRAGGYTYAPVFERRPEPGSDVWGVNVQEVRGNHAIAFRMTSPDGRYHVTIHDPEDDWHRLTLTEVSTGRKTILLDKDNAGQEAAQFLERLISAPFMILLGAGSI